MYTKVQIINLGLAKIASSRISRIDPPSNALERHCANGYEQWRKNELLNHRWVCAYEHDYALAQFDYDTTLEQPYVYHVPPDCLRPIRDANAEWKRRRGYFYSRYPNLKIDIIRDIQEDEFDENFVNVLAHRVALECVEFVTQSNTKYDRAEVKYDKAVADAKKNNAFVIGPESIAENDDNFPFVSGRY